MNPQLVIKRWNKNVGVGVSDQFTMERADLAKKDKGELQTIIAALGGKSSARMKKDDLIDIVLALATSGDSTEPSEPQLELETEVAEPSAPDAPAPEAPVSERDSGAGAPRPRQARSQDKPAEAGNEDPSAESKPQTKKPPKGETKPKKAKSTKGESKAKSNGTQSNGAKSDSDSANDNGDDNGNDNGNRRRRRRGRGRDNASEGPETAELVPVSGYLDLHDSGYGFLRVEGHRQSSNDVYVSVKTARTLALRPGDYVVGVSRPAQRNEKNPALQEVETISGLSPEEASSRPEFDSLTPVHPVENLVMEHDGGSATGRILDLFTPLAKGQRGLIIGGTMTGKSEMVAELAQSIEANNPEAYLFVVQLDERPEEGTRMRRRVPEADVVCSPFGRPAEEHVSAINLTLDRARRLVETGSDVVVLLDGLSRLVRAVSMGGHGGRASGGVDAAAIYAAKRSFGAARNTEEAGSLTIYATIGSGPANSLDSVLVEEFSHAANVEINLSRRLADMSVFPAIDLMTSLTKDENLLMDGPSLEMVRRIRESFTSKSESDPTAPLVSLLETISSTPTNEALLKQFT